MSVHKSHGKGIEGESSCRVKVVIVDPFVSL
jgi:hypothetical protein